MDSSLGCMNFACIQNQNRMQYKKLILLTLLTVLTSASFGQRNAETKTSRKISIYSPWYSLTNFGKESTNTHHYEILAAYQLTEKDRIGLKAATWKLFAPMGIPLWDEEFLKERSFYPGRLKEQGVGVTYQRRIYKGLFAAAEVLPLFTTYLDKENKVLSKGFKLYTTYHVGYHIDLFKGRVFLEPQLHMNYWPINTNRPAAFEAQENNWNNFFLFEPNLYIGIRF